MDQGTGQLLPARHNIYGPTPRAERVSLVDMHTSFPLRTRRFFWSQTEGKLDVSTRRLPMFALHSRSGVYDIAFKAMPIVSSELGSRVSSLVAHLSSQVKRSPPRQ